MFLPRVLKILDRILVYRILFLFSGSNSSLATGSVRTTFQFYFRSYFQSPGFGALNESTPVLPNGI